MDFHSTYRLSEGFPDGAVRAREIVDSLKGRDIALATGAWRPSMTLRFVQYEGVRLFDYVGTQRVAIRLVSDRIVDALKKGGATGWDAVPVGFSCKGRDDAGPYYVLVATGRCGPIDNSKSVQAHKAVIGNPKGGLIWKGLYFDETSWDGSDLFCPKGTAFFFVTERLEQVLEGFAADNIRLESLSDIERVSLV